MQIASCLNKYPQRFYPYPLKFQALIEKGEPFQFTQKFHSRPSENDIKLTEKCTKRFLYIVAFYITLIEFCKNHNIIKLSVYV